MGAMETEWDGVHADKVTKETKMLIRDMKDAVFDAGEGYRVSQKLGQMFPNLMTVWQ